jgi:hypothetical protein
MIWLAILLIIVLALCGLPLFAVIGAFALLGFYALDTEGAVVLIEFYRLVDSPVLLSIPLFTFAGYLFSESKTPQRLVRLTGAGLSAGRTRHRRAGRFCPVHCIYWRVWRHHHRPRRPALSGFGASQVPRTLLARFGHHQR